MTQLGHKIMEIEAAVEQLLAESKAQETFANKEGNHRYPDNLSASFLI